MAELLLGKPVADTINGDLITRVNGLKQEGIIPTLAVLRVGEKESDLSYERGAKKRCEQIGVEYKSVVLPENISEEVFFEVLESLNNDDEVHGILMLRPLPKTIDEEKARRMLKPEKDVDGCTDGSLAGVFANSGVGFAPCTAQAAMEILDFYNIVLTGKNVAVIGRSLVIGRPVAMMLMHKQATPTICHTRTANVAAIAKRADIVIAATGKMETMNADYFKAGQTVIDVGINWNEEKQKLCGDVVFEEVEPIVAEITPVPGGVGAVTTSVLVSHVVEAAEKTRKQ